MIKLPKIGDKIKWELRNPQYNKVKIMESIVSDVTEKYGGAVYVDGATSDDQFLVRLECIL